MSGASPQRLRKIPLPGHGSFLLVEGLEAGALLDALRAHRECRDPTRCLKRTHDRQVTRVPLRLSRGGEDVKFRDAVVKECRTRWRWRALHLLGWPSRFSSDPAKACRLEELGIRTPSFLGASLRVARGAEFLITEFVREGVSLRDLIWHGRDTVDDPTGLESLLVSVGAWLRRLHDQGVWQRDMKPDNLIVRKAGDSSSELFLVDITDVRFLSVPVDELRRVRNLGQLLDLPARFDPIAREPLLHAYLGHDAEECPRWKELVGADIEARRERRKRLFALTYVDEEAAHQEGEGHGPPK